MAICLNCGKTYFSKKCPYCKNEEDKEIKEIKKIEELKEREREILKKASNLKINYANNGNVNTEYRRRTYKNILQNKIKDKNYLHDLEHRYKKGIVGKIKIKNKKNNIEKTDFRFIITVGMIAILILVILLK